MSSVTKPISRVEPQHDQDGEGFLPVAEGAGQRGGRCQQRHDGALDLVHQDRCGGLGRLQVERVAAKGCLARPYLLVVEPLVGRDLERGENVGLRQRMRRSGDACLGWGGFHDGRG